ncbi:recombinase family protein [Klebsiella pneumoniae]
MGSCAAPSAKGDDKFITTDYLQQCLSTNEQTTENQIMRIRQAGYDILDSRVVSETVSGGVQAMQRRAFANMVDHKLEEGDTLVVLKLDRLGRDNIDVQQTITMLIERGIKVVSLDLPVRDLSSAEGKLMLQMFSSFAEFEKSRIIERTKEGLERAKQEGKILGRPVATETRRRVQEAREQGLSQSKAAQSLGLGIATIKRYWNI